MMQLVAGCVMEGSMLFCHKNVLGHSMMFLGDYKKRCLLTIMVSQILYLTQLISEIKNTFTAANGLFSTILLKLVTVLNLFEPSFLQLNYFQIRWQEIKKINEQH